MQAKPPPPAAPKSAAKPAPGYQRVRPQPGKKAGWVRRLLERLPQLISSSCALCGQEDRQTLCSPCRRQFFHRQFRRCVQCAMPIAVASKESRCGECQKSRPVFDATITATDYIAPADQLALALKFSGDLRLPKLMAGLIHEASMRPQIPGGDVRHAMPDMLVAVPLSRERLAERGFNQALEIAKPLASLLQVKLYPQLVERVLDTQAQSGLPLTARHRNIRKAFSIPYDTMDQVRGRHVGIVDDVMTTGATLNELAATLKRFGAKRVTCFVFARTLSG